MVVTAPGNIGSSRGQHGKPLRGRALTNDDASVRCDERFGQPKKECFPAVHSECEGVVGPRVATLRRGRSGVQGSYGVQNACGIGKHHGMRLTCAMACVRVKVCETRSTSLSRVSSRDLELKFDPGYVVAHVYLYATLAQKTLPEANVLTSSEL